MVLEIAVALASTYVTVGWSRATAETLKHPGEREMWAIRPTTKKKLIYASTWLLHPLAPFLGPPEFRNPRLSFAQLLANCIHWTAVAIVMFGCLWGAGLIVESWYRWPLAFGIWFLGNLTGLFMLAASVAGLVLMPVSLILGLLLSGLMTLLRVPGERQPSR